MSKESWGGGLAVETKEQVVAGQWGRVYMHGEVGVGNPEAGTGLVVSFLHHHHTRRHPRRRLACSAAAVTACEHACECASRVVSWRMQRLHHDAQDKPAALRPPVLGSLGDGRCSSPWQQDRCDDADARHDSDGHDGHDERRCGGLRRARRNATVALCLS